MLTYDDLNLKEIIKLKINLKEATIQTNLEQYGKANAILLNVEKILK